MADDDVAAPVPNNDRTLELIGTATQTIGLGSTDAYRVVCGVHIGSSGHIMAISPFLSFLLMSPGMLCLGVYMASGSQECPTINVRGLPAQPLYQVPGTRNKIQMQDQSIRHRHASSLDRGTLIDILPRVPNQVHALPHAACNRSLSCSEDLQFIFSCYLVRAGRFAS